MQPAVSNWIRVALAAMFTLSACSSAPAQEPQIDALADQMAASLSHAKLKTVAVLDFFGPYEMAALGQELTADFTAAFGKSAPGLQVEDPSQLVEMLHKNNLLPGSIRDAATASWFLHQTGVDAVILGTLSNASSGVKVRVRAFRVQNSHPISEVETTLPVTDDLKTLIGRQETDEFGFLPESGKKGYSSPSCIHCPQSQLVEEAAKAKFQGTVVLELTVAENGRARDIRARIAMPDGLTDKAIRTVQGWTFKPATGPDGKPAAVRQIVEITFHLY
jgi:TonB family protein